ncbi:MAG: hypothetical protein CFE43_13660 [Burkholderiales bacterium PBB3]|nr:MAG: hypothetical protein CFE43_13660 [Burkholderiales bacterium PBB3]
MNFLSRFMDGAVRGGVPKVSSLIADRRLGIVFQPIVNLHDGSICGYEALVRAPSTLSLGSTDALFDAAKAQQHQKQLELACIEAAIEQWAKKTNGSPLSLNISAKSLLLLEHGPADGALLKLLDNCRLPSRVLTMEITGLSSRIDPLELAGPLTKLRRQGVQITFDDFRCTESHVKLWSRLSPSIVKMDMKLTRGIASSAEQQKRVRALVALSRRHGNRLAAKGIETAEDIVALNDAGVDCGQGHFLGSPDAEPTEYLNKRAREALASGWGVDVPC